MTNPLMQRCSCDTCRQQGCESDAYSTLDRCACDLCLRMFIVSHAGARNAPTPGVFAFFCGACEKTLVELSRGAATGAEATVNRSQQRGAL